MPTIHTVTDANQSSYQKVGTTPISLSGSKEQVLLAGGATISSAADANANFSSGNGIYAGLVAGDVSLLLMGSVESASSEGIRMVSNGNKILIGSTGKVSGGTSGILLSDFSLGFGENWVDNWGLVKGTGATGIGIGASFSGNTISNMGAVEGFKGVVAGSAGSSNNKVFNGGSIVSTDAGVTLYGNGSSLTNTGVIQSGASGYTVVLNANAGETISMLNTGTIESGNTAISSVGMGSIRLTNQGTIIGTIQLGGGNDLYDGRGGVIKPYQGGSKSFIYLSIGNDTAYGGAGDEVFFGGHGNDFMDGGDGNDSFTIDDIGRDTAIGGAGDDTFYLGHGDLSRIISGNEGSDWLKLLHPDKLVYDVTINLGFSGLQKVSSHSGSIQLSGIENFTSTDGNDLLIGSSADNILVGNSGGDTLEGGLGNDVLKGEDGFDFARFTGSMGATVNLANTAAQVTNYGTDTFIGIEGLIGGAGADNFTGDLNGNDMFANAGKDTLSGGAGADYLSGGLGNDRLTGGADSDFFYFDAKLNAKTNVDTITDFSRVDDRIDLENAIFKKLTSTGVLSKLSFVVGAKAKDKNDYIVYDKAKGALYYDADGSGKGAAVKFAQLKKGLVIDHNDFFVI